MKNLLAVCFLFACSFFISNAAQAQNKMKITNKTGKQITYVFVEGWTGTGPDGDMLGDADGDVLEPGEEVTIDFQGCGDADASTQYNVKIVFKDGTEL
ncbi:MAG TPA: hypothetical protein DCM08_12990, partial [Microscillaceae bacterium]|nr:hypothetical protein [Microscillaceae bacterium]